MDWPIARPFHPSQKYYCPIFSVRIYPSETGRVLPQTYRTLDFWQLNAARLPARIGHKQPLAGASPSPTETVRGVRPLPRPTLASSLTKTVPCLLSRDLFLSGLSRICHYQGSVHWFRLESPLVGHLSYCHLSPTWRPTYHFPLRSRPHRSAGYA